MKEIFNSSSTKITSKTWDIIKNRGDEKSHLYFPGTGGNYGRQLSWSNNGLSSQKFRIDLYRFLRDNIPLLNACIWTWSRLSSAPGRFEIDDSPVAVKLKASNYLEKLARR